MTIFEFQSCPEIYQLEIGVGALVGEQEILGLDISVHYFLRVEVSYDLEDIVEVRAGICFSKGLLLDDAIEQLSPSHQLGHQVERPGLLVHIEHFDYVGVILF